MASDEPYKPTPEELARAEGRRVDDVIDRGLRVLFCGINPGLYSGAVGHHFARPGNRFWPALHAGGFTDGQLSPFEERKLLDYGLGVTNLVNRATARASELTAAQLRGGGAALTQKVRRYQPTALAVLGLTAYRTAFGRPDAEVGEQPDHRLDGKRVWALPNPSGLNAHYQLEDFAALFRKLREAV